MMRMTMVMALGFACAVSAWADDAPEVATAERIGLAYNQLGIGVTLKTPGATHVKVVLKDAQGAPVATKEAEVSGAAATVNFPDLTPGGIYQYDVFLKGDGDYVAPADWKPISVNLFSSVDWFDFAAGVFRQATPDATTVRCRSSWGCRCWPSACWRSCRRRRSRRRGSGRSSRTPRRSAAASCWRPFRRARRRRSDIRTARRRSRCRSRTGGTAGIRSAC